MKRTGKKNAFVCTLTNILVLKIYQTKTSTIQITTSSIFNILMYKKEKKKLILEIDHFESETKILKSLILGDQNKKSPNIR